MSGPMGSRGGQGDLQKVVSVGPSKASTGRAEVGRKEGLSIAVLGKGRHREAGGVLDFLSLLGDEGQEKQQIWENISFPRHLCSVSRRVC